MAENGARVAWAGAGLMLPWRLLGRGSLRAAVRRLLGDGSFRERAGEIAAWAREHDGAQRGAELVEELGRSERLKKARSAGLFELRGWDSNPQPIG